MVFSTQNNQLYKSYNWLFWSLHVLCVDFSFHTQKLTPNYMPLRFPWAITLHTLPKHPKPLYITILPNPKSSQLKISKISHKSLKPLFSSFTPSSSCLYQTPKKGLRDPYLKLQRRKERRKSVLKLMLKVLDLVASIILRGIDLECRRSNNNQFNNVL